METNVSRTQGSWEMHCLTPVEMELHRATVMTAHLTMGVKLGVSQTVWGGGAQC